MQATVRVELMLGPWQPVAIRIHVVYVWGYFPLLQPPPGPISNSCHREKRVIAASGDRNSWGHILVLSHIRQVFLAPLILKLRFLLLLSSYNGILTSTLYSIYIKLDNCIVNEGVELLWPRTKTIYAQQAAWAQQRFPVSLWQHSSRKPISNLMLSNHTTLYLYTAL